MVQVPPALNVTTPDEIEHVVLVDDEIVNVTGRPEVAVAAGVYVPPTVADAGGVLVKVIP